MWRRILLEASIVTVQTVALIGLCATFGIPRSDPKANSGRPLGLDLYRPKPADNPATPDKVRLGHRLFRERLLSRDHSIACGDCHQPKRAFTDGCPVRDRVGEIKGDATRPHEEIATSPWSIVLSRGGKL